MSEKRARDLEQGDTYREFGMEDWHIVEDVWQGDDVRIEHESGSDDMDGDTVVEVR